MERAVIIVIFEPEGDVFRRKCCKHVRGAESCLFPLLLSLFSTLPAHIPVTVEKKRAEKDRQTRGRGGDRQHVSVRKSSWFVR